VIKIAIFAICSAFLLAGCTDNSADTRLRKLLDILPGQELTETLVTEKLGSLFPKGMPEPLIAEKAKAMGVGANSLSGYYLIKERNMAVVRVEFDRDEFKLVKEAWMISFNLDPDSKVQSIRSERYLTGL
jgi:hypothetical protein